MVVVVLCAEYDNQNIEATDMGRPSKLKGLKENPPIPVMPLPRTDIIVHQRVRFYRMANYLMIMFHTDTKRLPTKRQRLANFMHTARRGVDYIYGENLYDHWRLDTGLSADRDLFVAEHLFIHKFNEYCMHAGVTTMEQFIRNGDAYLIKYLPPESKPVKEINFTIKRPNNYEPDQDPKQIVIDPSKKRPSLDPDDDIRSTFEMIKPTIHRIPYPDSPRERRSSSRRCPRDGTPFLNSTETNRIFLDNALRLARRLCEQSMKLHKQIESYFDASD